MREIKFRGKRVDNGEWVYGFYFNIMFKDGSKRHFILPYEVDAPKSKTLGEIQIEVRPETVGQYTGLKDKNNVDIYKGDIIRERFYNGVIVWHNNGWFVLEHDDPSPQEFESEYAKEFEVIGNIHDKE